MEFIMIKQKNVFLTQHPLFALKVYVADAKAH